MTYTEMKDAYIRNWWDNFINEMCDHWSRREYEISNECRARKAELERINREQNIGFDTSAVGYEMASTYIRERAKGNIN